MLTRLLDALPNWLHPRYPLVAKENRHLEMVDLPILQLGTVLRPLLAGSIWLPIFLAILSFIVSGTRLFGFILFPFTVIITLVVVIVGELLFWRILFSIPLRVGDMIAGERERGTWDTLLSTPIPRSEIILSKFSAIFWNHGHALWPLLVGRGVVMLLLLVEHLSLTEQGQAAHTNNIAMMVVIGLLLCFSPLIELACMAAFGLLLSIGLQSRIFITLMVWFYWFIYRSGMAFLVLLNGRLPVDDFLQQVGLILFPHWMFYLVWINADYSQHDTLLFYGGGLYIVTPLVFCIMSLALTIRFVQYQESLISPIKHL